MDKPIHELLNVHLTIQKLFIERICFLLDLSPTCSGSCCGEIIDELLVFFVNHLNNALRKLPIEEIGAQECLEDDEDGLLCKLRFLQDDIRGLNTLS